MGRHRKPAPPNVIKLDFYSMLDRVTLDTKPFYVPQEDGRPNPFAEIIGSRVWQRQPRLLETPIPRWRGAIIFPNQPGKKWCSVCGDWIDKQQFSPKADTFDKLHPYCKACRARHARRMYWAAKETAVQKVA